MVKHGDCVIVIGVSDALRNNLIKSIQVEIPRDIFAPIFFIAVDHFDSRLIETKWASLKVSQSDKT